MKIKILSLALLLASTAAAQINNNDSGTEILKPFKAKLAESKKFDSSPTQPKIDSQANKNLEYIVPTRLKELVYPRPKLQPLDLAANKNGKDEEKIPTFYARFGAGYPFSILGELSYHTAANDKYRFGATFDHRSGRGNYNDNQRYMQNNLRLQGAYFLKSGIGVDGALGLNINSPRFYGYGDTLVLPKDSVRQQLTTVSGQVGLFSAKANKANLSYRGELGLYNHSDRFGTNEFSISPNVKVEKYFGGKTSKNALVVDLGLNFVSLNDTFASLDSSLVLRQSPNRTLVHFHPYFNYDGGIFRARIGTRLGVSEGDFYIYPDVEASAGLLKGKINIFAGWSGAVRQNNFRSLSEANNFVVSYLNTRHTGQQDFYGGIKGSIKKYSYNAQVSYSLANNSPIFINDSLSQNRRFIAVYDSIQTFTISGGLDFEITKGLNFSTNLNFYAFRLAQLDKAYHRPNFVSDFNLSYTKGKFSAAANLYIGMNAFYLNPETQLSAALPNLYDFNLSASYSFTKNIGAFVQVNNILNNQAQIWHRYPQIGFNALAGVRASF
jgi:hypothetical protein